MEDHSPEAFEEAKSKSDFGMRKVAVLAAWNLVVTAVIAFILKTVIAFFFNSRIGSFYVFFGVIFAAITLFDLFTYFSTLAGYKQGASLPQNGPTKWKYVLFVVITLLGISSFVTRIQYPGITIEDSWFQVIHLLRETLSQFGWSLAATVNILTSLLIPLVAILYFAHKYYTQRIDKNLYRYLAVAAIVSDILAIILAYALFFLLAYVSPAAQRALGGAELGAVAFLVMPLISGAAAFVLCLLLAFTVEQRIRAAYQSPAVVRSARIFARAAWMVLLILIGTRGIVLAATFLSCGIGRDPYRQCPPVKVNAQTDPSVCEGLQLNDANMCYAYLAHTQKSIPLCAKISYGSLKIECQRELCGVDLCSGHFVDVSAALQNVGRASSLSLRNKGLTTLPPEVLALSNATYLDLGGNQLSSLPSEIGNLTNLEELHLDLNKLLDLPSEIAKLQKLRALSLSNNGLLEHIPEGVFQLSNLNRLYLEAVGLRKIPPEIGNLTNLEFLDIHVNNLTFISDEIRKLTKLKKINVDGNALDNSELAKLRSLLPHAVINSISQDMRGKQEIGECGRPESNAGSYTESPNTYERLYTSLEDAQQTPEQVKILCLNHKGISTLPPEINLLVNLEELYLDSNNLTGLPPEIARLTRLRVLQLSRNPQIKKIPPEVFQLSSLTQLYLQATGLTQLPTEIGTLTNLQWLNLQGNALTTLPDSIGKLTKLERFNVSDNYLDTNEFTKITRLLPQIAPNTVLEFNPQRTPPGFRE